VARLSRIGGQNPIRAQIWVQPSGLLTQYVIPTTAASKALATSIVKSPTGSTNLRSGKEHPIDVWVHSRKGSWLVRVQWRHSWYLRGIITLGLVEAYSVAVSALFRADKPVTDSVPPASTTATLYEPF